MELAVPPGLQCAVLDVLVGDAHWGVPAASVQEILRPRPLTRVPHGPESLLGILNLRGTALPVLSLARLLEQSPAELPGTARIVVVIWRGAAIGLRVCALVGLRQTGEVPPLDLEALLAAQARLNKPASAQPALPPPPPVGEAAPRQALLVFDSDGQAFALPLHQVVQVTRVPRTIAPLLADDPAVAGAVPWRAGLLPLVRLRALLGQPRAGDESLSRVVVVRLGAMAVGLLVDRVTGVLRLSAASILAMPPVLTRGRGEARIVAVCRLEDDRLAAILSPDHLFEPETARRIAAAQPGEGAAATPMPQEDDETAFVLFTLGGAEYGLPVSAVREVVRRPAALSKLPGTPGFVEGMMNLRGHAIPVIDQAARFATDGGRSQRIMILASGDVQAGLAVAQVRAVRRLRAADLHPLSTLAGVGEGADRVAIDLDGDAVTLLLDPRALAAALAGDMRAYFSGQGVAAR